MAGTLPVYFVPNPTKLEYRRWVMQLIQDLPIYEIPLPTTEANWRFWANQFIKNNNIDNAPLPTKATFPKKEDWRRWFSFFVQGSSIMVIV